MNDAYQHSFGLPAVGGGYFNGPPPIKARWAKITSSAVVSGVTFYDWTEQTPLRLGFTPTVGGMYGTTRRNPVIEPNGLALANGSFVRVRPAYFDAQYDMIYYAETNPLSGSDVDASATQAGDVNLAAGQVLGDGYKLFNKSLYVNAALADNEGLIVIYVTNTSGTPGFYFENQSDHPGSAAGGVLYNPTTKNTSLLSNWGQTGNLGELSFKLDADLNTGDLTAVNSPAASYSCRGLKGLSVTITTAKLTAGGANGSMTFTGGILTAQTAAT